MVLEYDFDIVTTEAGETDSKSVPSGAPIARAVFRDVRTAEALRAASPKIRDIFQQAGFDLEPVRSDVSRGFYRTADSAHRERILRTLFANIRDMGVRGEYCGAFDLGQFIDSVKYAQPLPETIKEAPDTAPTPIPAMPAKPKRRTVQGRIGISLGLAVILILVLRYLASAGAAP